MTPYYKNNSQYLARRSAQSGSCLFVAIASLIFVVAIPILMFNSCAVENDLPPSDQELVSIYQKYDHVFKKLADKSEDQSGLTVLGVKRVMKSGSGYYFRVWFRDYFGPGWEEKGLAYMPQLPRETKIVDRIDGNTGPDGTGEVFLARGVENNWYLYYYSTD